VWTAVKDPIFCVQNIFEGVPLDSDVDYYVIIINLLETIFTTQGEPNLPDWRSHWTHNSITLPTQGMMYAHDALRTDASKWVSTCVSSPQTDTSLMMHTVIHCHHLYQHIWCPLRNCLYWLNQRRWILITTQKPWNIQKPNAHTWGPIQTMSICRSKAHSITLEDSITN
jgi:hypothetical protein